MAAPRDGEGRAGVSGGRTQETRAPDQAEGPLRAEAPTHGAPLAGSRARGDSRRLVVLGVGTGVGKTYVAAALVAALDATVWDVTDPA